MLRSFLVSTLIVFILVAPCLAEAPKIGEISPELTLPGLFSGKDFSLSTAYGRPMVLTFFASWSKSCQKQLTYLSQLAQTNKLNIVAVSFDRNGNQLKEFINSEGLNNIYVLRDKKLSSIDKYAILIIPTSFLINEKGLISGIYVDYDENVEKAISHDLDKLLSGK